jgi:hypothetical protein
MGKVKAHGGLQVLHLLREAIGEAGNTGRFETTCAILARKIFANEVKTATDAFQELREFYPNDDEFRQAFSVKQERNNTKAQYFLKGIEREARRVDMGAAAGETQLSDSLTLEHILPKNPSEEWKSETAADKALVEECVFRLGNMCLLTTVNKDIGRKSFEEKKAAYKDSDILTTRGVVNYGHWDRKNIEHRQVWFAKLAAGAWRFQ